MTTGDDQFRRALYVHWQRQFLHPWLLAFDAPTREECTAERPISSTPTAALVLLNDPSFVEAARALARKYETEGVMQADRIKQMEKTLADQRDMADGALVAERELLYPGSCFALLTDVNSLDFFDVIAKK